MGSKAGTCDLIAQNLQRQPGDSLDFARTAKFTLFCVTYVGMFQHCVFNVLYPRIFPGEGFVTALKKTLFDNFVHSPFVYLPSFYIYKNIAGGRGAVAGLEEYRDEGLRVLQGCWGLWLPAQMLCFSVIPPTFRIMFNAGVGCVWEVALSYMSPCLHSSSVA
jgi:protein Mpv17